MPERIDTARLRALLDRHTQLVEVLPAAEYRELHLPGATNVPLTQLDSRSTAELDRGRPVAVYCHDHL